MFVATSVLLCHSRTVRPVHELSSQSSRSRDKTKSRLRNRANQDGFLKDKESKFSLIVVQRFNKHEFQADSDKRSIKESSGIFEISTKRSLRTRISFQHYVSNTFGLCFRVWVQALSSCFLGQTRLDFWFLVVYKHQSPPVSQTHSDLGSSSAYTHQSRIPICHTHPFPALFKLV